MKNKNIQKQIINEYYTITETPNNKVWKKFENYTDNSDKTQNKKRVKLPPKILATAAAIILITGLFNIQTVTAFIGGLFFAPGAGVTQGIDITYYGLEKPIDIETEYGILTLKFINKITKNGNTVLALYINSTDIPALETRNGEYPLTISIGTNEENIVSGADLSAAAGWGSDGYNSVTYMYIHENFPDINEFDLKFDNLGIETRIILTNQPDNFVLSNEINGITLAVSKFNGVTDMLTYDVYDSSETASTYNVFGNMVFDVKYYDKNGEEIHSNGGSGGFNPDSNLNYQLSEFYKNEKEIKSIKANQLSLMYNSVRKESTVIEIPVPNDGETINVNVELKIGSHIFRITEVRREGDTIYYESNSHEVLTERATDDADIGSFTSQGIPSGWDEDQSAYEQAVANGESFIQFIHFSPAEQLTEPFQGTIPKMGGGQIWNFDENAKSLTFYFVSASIIQYGNFNIEFES